MVHAYSPNSKTSATLWVSRCLARAINPDKKPGKEEFKKIIMFLVPRLEKDVAPSKFGTMKKAKDKLVELQNKFNKPRIEIVEEQ